MKFLNSNDEEIEIDIFDINIIEKAAEFFVNIVLHSGDVFTVFSTVDCLKGSISDMQSKLSNIKISH